LKHRIEFPCTAFDAVVLPACASLPLHLTVRNSPVLFGCRSGLCATCLVEVEAIDGQPIEGPDTMERETLEIYAPGNPRARLACQLQLTADIRIRRLEPA
jgi:ferredoxin